MATLQVKGIDDALYKVLGRRAAMDNRSVSQEVVVMIKEFLAGSELKNKPRNKAITDSLLELAGSWEDERSAVAMAKDLRKARRHRQNRVKGRYVFA